MAQNNWKGAAAELEVAADLLRRGNQVFRALSPAASCDLLVLEDDGTITRIEVRSAMLRRDGTISPAVARKDVGRCDLYAFVAGTRIEYMTPEQAYADYRQARCNNGWRTSTEPPLAA